MGMTCPSCGVDLDAGLFCPNCGGVRGSLPVFIDRSGPAIVESLTAPRACSSSERTSCGDGSDLHPSASCTNPRLRHPHLARSPQRPRATHGRIPSRDNGRCRGATDSRSSQATYVPRATIGSAAGSRLPFAPAAQIYVEQMWSRNRKLRNYAGLRSGGAGNRTRVLKQRWVLRSVAEAQIIGGDPATTKTDAAPSGLRLPGEDPHVDELGRRCTRSASATLRD